MLSEGYLSGIPYHNLLNFNLCNKQEEESAHELRSLNGVMYESTGEMNGRNPFWRCMSVGKIIYSVCSKENRNSRRQKDTLTSQSPSFKRQTSTAMDICIGSATSREAYLVPSSCKSICKNYNDLHIAGDQVMPLNSMKRDFTFDSGLGPFLESSEIPSAMESTSTPPDELPYKPIQGYPSCWRLASIMHHHHQPLSNSILNNYLEEKVMELYKQYIMDGLGNSTSPTQILASEFIMTNVDQISMKLSQEKKMNTTKAKDMVINCLLRLASGKASTEMSTPSLHISQFSTVTK